MRLVPRRARLGLAFAAVLALAPAASAYTPGSGTIYSDDFEGALDPDWTQGNGIGSPSPWTQIADGGDTSFYADGRGPFAFSPSTHWAQHPLHPVRATSFSIAFEYRAELGAGYLFDLEIQQRAPVLRKVRLRIDGQGTGTLARTENGSWVDQVSSPAPLVSANVKHWIRVAFEEDAGTGDPWVRVRSWTGSATAEPAGWDLEFLDDNRTIERVHRFEITADGPAGVETFIDDLDAFGDGAAGVESSVRTIYVAELSHLDIGFTEPPDDIEAFAKSHLDDVLNNLDLDPDYRWQIESGWWLDRWWVRSDETEHQRMIDALRGGRIALGAGYANLQTSRVGHEQLTRALYYSTALGREHGFPVRTWITDDVPGSNFALPELLARSGVEYFVGGMNTSFGGRVTTPGMGDRPFWWVGPDGSRVLAWTTFDSYAEGFRWGFSFFDTLADLYTKMGQKIPEIEEAGYPWPELMLLRGFDNHYQGFHVRNLVDQWNATYQTPVFVLATPEEFLDLMLQKYGAEAFPAFSGDYGPAWANSFANAPHTQDWIREAHRMSRQAEALHAVASVVDGAAVPQDRIDFAVRKIVESDEHTGAGGWPGMFTPEEMERNNRIHLGYATDARDTSAALLAEGQARLMDDLPAVGDAIVAINPLGRARDGWVRQVLPQELYDQTFRIVDRTTGVEVVFQRFDATREVLFRAEAVPAFGYRVYDIVPGTPTAVPQGVLAIDATSLENDAYRLVVDPTDGALTSVQDKVRGREMIDLAAAYRFNALASNIKQEVDGGQLPVAVPPVSASTEILSSGPLLVELKVTRTGTPHVETVYRLYRGEDRVEIENTFDRDQMPYVPHAIAWRAYTVTLPFDVHDFQIRSETTTRFLDPVADAFPRTSYFDWHNAEHTLAFFDDTSGVLYACDAVPVHHFETFHSLAPPDIADTDALLLPRMFDRVDEYEFEDETIGPFVIEPDTSPIHRYTHHFRATDPVFDPVRASRFGFEALEPLRSELIGRQPGNLPDTKAGFIVADPDDVLVYTVKRAHVGEGLVLRMTELTGVETPVTIRSDVLRFTAAERIEQDEDASTPLVPSGGAVSLTLAPYETATLRVEAEPVWEPIALTVSKTASAVRLDWSGGTSPYTLRRADDARFTTGQVTLLDEQPQTGFDDPVLDDGRVYFYLVR